MFTLKMLTVCGTKIDEALDLVALVLTLMPTSVINLSIVMT
jgi:hypothetical protein